MIKGEIVYPLSKREEWVIARCAGVAYAVVGVILVVGIVYCMAYA